MRSEQITEDTYLVTHEVNEADLRLDTFLKQRYRKRSRAQIQRAIEEGSITVEREQGPHLSVGRLKSSSTLVVGDRVLVCSERKPEPEVSFDYKILFEDEDLLIIDKPANLPVHPSGRYFFNTLLTHLKTRGHREPLRSEDHYYLVHRLDKETSGVMALAKTKEACSDLVRQFARRETEKTYLAITHGETPATFVNAEPIMRAPNSLIEVRMGVGTLEAGAQEARTEFTRLSTHRPASRGGKAFSLVECRPRTGRQHQIRVHLDHAGYPIVGDKLYGMPESESLHYYERKHLTPEAQARLLLPRHALHAHKLRFTDPKTKIPREFVAALPGDLVAFLKD